MKLHVDLEPYYYLAREPSDRCMPVPNKEKCCTYISCGPEWFKQGCPMPCKNCLYWSGYAIETEYKAYKESISYLKKYKENNK